MSEITEELMAVRDRMRRRPGGSPHILRIAARALKVSESALLSIAEDYLTGQQAEAKAKAALAKIAELEQEV